MPRKAHPTSKPASARPLVLASASPRRRELLALLGIPFEVVPSAYEEVLPERDPIPKNLAQGLALEKAREVAARRPEALVLGADTVVALEDRLFGKPRSAEHAAGMLALLSGVTHEVITGVALVCPEDRAERVFAVSTEVTFRTLHAAEIDEYVRTGEPMDKAGGYAVQGVGGLLVQELKGDYPNVVGLPIGPLALHLRALGIPILGACP